MIKKAWITDRPSDKLSEPLAGPFEIERMAHSSYKLKLPDSYKISPIFHADRLRRDPDNALPGQINTPVSEEAVFGNQEWEIEKVLSSRLHYSTLQYKVQWKGWDPDDTWYPARNFKNSAAAILRFHDINPDESGPPIRIQEWLRAAAEDLEPEDHSDDDVPQEAGVRRTRRRNARR